VPEFGAKGAAFATLAAEAGIAGLYWIVLLGSGMVRYDLTLVPRVVAAGLPAAALVFTPLEDIPLVVAATLVYWIVLLAVRGIPPEVIDALLRRERPETP
jgi:hypothetical protein